MCRFKVIGLASVMCACLFMQTAGAQSTNPFEPGNTSSPRDTMRTFLRAVDAGIKNYRLNGPLEERLILVRLLLSCLDLSNMAPAEQQSLGIQKALLLKEVLGRTALPPLDEIPGLEEVEEKGIKVWLVPHTGLTLARQTSGDRAGNFLFTKETLASLEDTYEIAKRFPYQPDTTTGIYEEILRGPGPLIPAHWVFGFPSWSFKTVLGTAIWKWIALFVVLGVWIVAIWGTTVLAVRIDRRQRTAGKVVRPILPLAAILIIALTYVAQVTASNAIGVGGSIWNAAQIVFWLVVFAVTAWLAIILVQRLSDRVIASQRLRPASLDSQFIRICFRLLGILLVTYVGVFAAEFFGIPVAPLLAGLGVGGLAIGLAVRPTLENIVGGLMLFTDKPVRVGDFCRFGDSLGTVEEIGLRSTRIRSLSRTIITIPNGEFSQLQLENYAHRDRILFSTKLGLRYETTADQLRHVLANLRKMLLGHPKVQSEGMRVRFSEFGSDSLSIDIFAYVNSTDWREFLGIREDINLRIMDIVNASGTKIALPSQTYYLARDAGLDAERADAAETKVGEWRSQGVLPFPDFEPEYAAERENKLDFPPSGSSQQLQSNQRNVQDDPDP